VHCPCPAMEMDMATIVLKGISVELRKRLEERARSNGRSVGREAIACLESVVGLPERSPAPEKSLLDDIRNLREEIAATTGLWITNQEIDEAKRKGRP
jgi:plasmid stability protein